MGLVMTKPIFKSRRPLIWLVSSILVLASACAFYNFGRDDHWIYAVVFGVILPACACRTWQLLQRSAEDNVAREQADMLLVLFSTALLAAGF
jgi:preprotein translocase subunit Sec63